MPDIAMLAEIWPPTFGFDCIHSTAHFHLLFLLIIIATYYFMYFCHVLFCIFSVHLKLCTNLYINALFFMLMFNFFVIPVLIATYYFVFVP